MPNSIVSKIQFRVSIIKILLTYLLLLPGCLLHMTDDKVSKSPPGLLALLFSGSDPYLRSGEIFDPVTGKFATVENSLNVPRYHHTSNLLNDGRVVIIGGYYPYGSSSTSVIDKIEIYDPHSNLFQNSAQNLIVARNSHAATLLQNGRILITGGQCLVDSPATNTAEEYDPQTQTSVFVGNLNVARCQHQSTLLNDGKVLIAGGVDPISGNNILPVELYDPISKSFSLKGNLLQARTLFSILVPAVGNAMIIGGVNYTSATDTYVTLSETETFDETTGLLSVGPSLVSPLRAFGATTLQDGRVLISGGSNEGAVMKEAEILDFGFTVFTKVNLPLLENRQYHTSNLLVDGKVLIAGGRFVTTVYSDSEIFDPNTNSFHKTGSLIQKRYSATSHSLPNGKVILIGGRSSY